jgi:ArsR family transcriptional regulator
MDPYRTQANLLKLMAHPTRLRILEALLQDSECVCHLSALLHKPQPYVSQQLAVLRNGGVVIDEKEGTNVFYRLVDGHTAAVTAAVVRGDDGAASAPRSQHTRLEDCPCPKCRGGDACCD